MIPSYMVPTVPQPKPPQRIGLTTPEQVYTPETAPYVRPMRLAAEDRMRVMAAAHAVRKAYPGPIGDLAHAEILAHGELGYLGDPNTAVLRLIAELLD